MGPLIIPTPIPAIDVATVAETGVQMRMPMRLGQTPQGLWLLPYEPLVAVRGRNVITRRTIAKYNKERNAKRGFGSVKELWTKDDFEVVITGMLHDHARPDELPTAQITRLNDLCSLARPLAVTCSLFEALGIAEMVVDSWEFPATPGIGYQAYSIKAYSDQTFDLFVDK